MCGVLFRNRRQQGSWRRAYMDVFTARYETELCSLNASFQKEYP